MSLKFLEVKDQNMMEKVFAFRYRIMSEVKEFREYFLDANFQNGLESDVFDKYAVHFIALDDSDAICANVRLIHHCPDGYPTENQMIFDNSVFERDKLGEVSRIFIDKRYRNLQKTKEIVYNLNRLLYIKMVELGIEYTYGSLEPSFRRLLGIYNMHYEILGEEQKQGKMGLRIPCILYTQRLGDDNLEFTKDNKGVHAL